MIEAARFTNVDGSYIDFNDNELPFTDFSTAVDTRFTERSRSQQHGIYPGNTFLGKRLFHVEGNIEKQTSAEYWVKRMQLLDAIMPRPQIGQNAGTLAITFTGMEQLSADCTLDSWPEIPIQALSPSRSPYQINWKAFDPRLYGAWQQYDTAPPPTPAGRTYAKTYAKTYPAATASGDALIYNSGNIESFGVITLYGAGSNPGILLVKQDGTFKRMILQGLTLGTNDTVVVDMGYRTAILNSTVNVYSYAVGSDWFAFEPGNNTIRYTGSATDANSKARVKWRSAYMI